MSVDDHGLEVLRKSALPLTPGSKAEYYLRVALVASNGSGVQTVKPYLEDSKIISNQVNTVPAASTVSLVTYTVPAGKVFYLGEVTVGGENIADYSLKINAAEHDRMRTYFGGPLSISVSQGFLKCVAGDSILLEVNNFRNSTADFEGKLIGVERDV